MLVVLCYTKGQSSSCMIIKKSFEKVLCYFKNINNNRERKTNRQADTCTSFRPLLKRVIIHNRQLIKANLVNKSKSVYFL
jgi:hypothetical protein